MRSEIRVAPVFRSILYAQAWEDPAVDEKAMRIDATDDVFAIGASGDNALSFLLQEPKSVTALDFNLTQCCLLELKMAAIDALRYGELLEFVGVRPSQLRLVYYRRLREALGESARGYWDANPQIIEAGVIHEGKFERYFGKFRRFILPLIHGEATCDALLDCRSLEEQRVFYDARWNTIRWRMLFGLFFNRFVMGKYGRDPAMFKYVTEDVATTIMARARHGISETPAATNWFMEYILRGNYKTLTRLPPYLLEDNQPKLRRLLDRVTVINDEIEAFLPTRGEGGLSKFYLSDIFEYMSQPAADELFQALYRSSRDGGVLSYREMMVARPHPASLAEGLIEDKELGAWCHHHDRAFFYGAHHVLNVRKPAKGGETEKGGASDAKGEAKKSEGKASKGKKK